MSIKNFVTFYSPGTLFPETTKREISSWDIELAKTMSRTITQRHRAKPHSFHFSNSKEVFSPLYILGGRVMTLSELKIKNDPSDEILIRNMEMNNIDRVVINTNSHKASLALGKGDILLDY